LTVARLDADGQFPATVGGTVTWTPTTAGGDGAPLEYLYYRYDEATQAWTLARPYGATPTLSWTPGASDIGRHWLQVWVRRQGATAAYEAWAGTSAFDVTASEITLTLGSSQGDPPNVPAGTPIMWTATPTIGPGPLEYLFWRYDAQSGTWSVVQSYGPSDTYTWTPSEAEAGEWRLQVWARRVGSAQAHEAWSGTAFLIQP